MGMVVAANETDANAFDFRRADHGRSENQSLLWKLRRPLVPVAKDAIRRYGALTSARRVSPDYLLIGAKRGGSTTLARSLVASQGIAPLFPRREALKGTYFFDVNYHRGAAWYRSHFPTQSTRGDNIVGDASPYYLSHPHAPQRAHELVPQARIICVLRDPVERAFSHYRERVKQGIETLPTFEDALDAEPDRIAGEFDRMVNDPSYVSWNHLNFAYTDQSRYGASLERWLQHWPREQLLVLRSEDLYADPHGTLNQTRAFLGLAPIDTSATATSHENRLPAADVAPNTRRRLWAELTTDIEQLATLLDTSPWWAEDASNVAPKYGVRNDG